MKHSIKIISVVLILIFAGTIILSVSTSMWFGSEVDQQRNERGNSNWQTFRNDDFNFTFQHPPEAIVDISDPEIANEPKRVRVRLIGPESEPKTEITDGFTFYVRSTTLNEQETFSEASQQIFQTETERREVIRELSEATNIRGRNAYTFSVCSELESEVTYTIMEGSGDTFFITISIVSIPDNFQRNYDAIIQRMQESLQTISISD